VDLSAYTGQAGDEIKIRALDDFGVASVHVTLIDGQNGVAIENGSAVEIAAGSGLWDYTATVNVSSGTNVNINVVATDHPGGTAIETQSKSIQGLAT
jgi:hypothetical protein